jgi:hypothetical protein
LSPFTDTCRPIPSGFIHIPEVEDIEILAESEVDTLLWYQPQLDEVTRDIAKMRALRGFGRSTPGNGILCYELFPNITDHMEYMSMSNDSLRSTFVAITALIRDLSLQQPPGEVYYSEKSKSLRLIQEAISTGALDASLFTAVLMQVFSDLCLGNLRAIQHHLRGMYQIFKRLQQATGSVKKLSPDLLFFRRIAARTDSAQASLFEDYPQWPAFNPLDELDDRRVLSTLTGVSKNMAPQNVEWALASFEIDNLWHRVYTFAKRSDITRKSGDTNAEESILIQYHTLTQNFESWKHRTIVFWQETIERDAQQHILANEHKPFLSYEPLNLQNHFYGKLMNQWRAIYIYAATTLNPFPGPESHPSKILEYAIDMCRTHAALGSDGIAGPQWQCLFYAGIIFGKQFADECGWIMERCRGAAAVFPVITLAVENMPMVWNAETVHWNALGRLWPGVGREE